MAGVIYVGCTPVTRQLIQTHVGTFGAEIPLLGIVNLNRTRAATKANFDSLYDLQLQYEIPIHYCRNVNDKATLEFIAQGDPTLLIQSGWSQKFRRPLLELPKFGCLGEHPAPIPKGRGAACVNWAILNGEEDWGDTFFRMVDEYDAGPVYAQRHFRIEAWDTCKTVYDKVAWSASDMLRENLPNWYAGKFADIPLDESQASYYPRRTPADGELDFAWDADKLQRYVRALTKPYPGAFFAHQGRKVLVWESAITARFTKSDGRPFLGIANEYGLDVAVGEGQMWRLLTVQPEGLPEMTGADFYRRFVAAESAAPTSSLRTAA